MQREDKGVEEAAEGGQQPEPHGLEQPPGEQFIEHDEHLRQEDQRDRQSEEQFPASTMIARRDAPGRRRE